MKKLNNSEVIFKTVFYTSIVGAGIAFTYHAFFKETAPKIVSTINTVGDISVIVFISCQLFLLYKRKKR